MAAADGYTLFPAGANGYGTLESAYTALPNVAATNGYTALPDPANNGYVALPNAAHKKLPVLYITPSAPTTTGIYSYDNGKGHSGISTFVMPDGTPFNDFVKSKAYEKHKYLGHGFFSSAYKLGFSDGAEFVLKVGDRKYVRSFVEQEAATLAALKDNKYVNKLLVAQIEPETAYMLIEYIPGKTLEAWIREGHTAEERAEIKKELRAGINSIHAAGFVHTDIKADNIWIPDDRRKEAMYIDFGLAEPIGKERRRINGKTLHMNPSINNLAIDNMFRTFGGGARKTRKQRRL